MLFRCGFSFAMTLAISGTSGTVTPRPTCQTARVVSRGLQGLWGKNGDKSGINQIDLSATFLWSNAFGSVWMFAQTKGTHLPRAFLPAVKHPPNLRHSGRCVIDLVRNRFFSICAEAFFFQECPPLQRFPCFWRPKWFFVKAAFR